MTLYNTPKPKKPEKEDKGVIVNVVIDNQEVLSELKRQATDNVAIRRELNEIQKTLKTLEQQGVKTMATLEGLKAKIAAGNVSLNGIKADIADLKAGGGMTAVEEAELETVITELADSLAATDAEHPPVVEPAP